MKHSNNLFQFAAGSVKLLLLVFALCVILPAPHEVQAASKKVDSVTVTNLPAKTLTLKKGKSFTLKTKVVGAKGISQTVTYKTSKKKVATVSSKGVIKAVKNGKATITVTSKANTKKSLKITVTVGTPVTKVTLNQTSAEIVKGKKTTLKASVAPKKPSNKSIVWSSSNEKVATVNSKGVVTGVSAGTAKITAAAADGSGKKATASITVKNPVTLTKVSVLNAATLQVQLSDPQVLTAQNFTVKASKYNTGRYNKTIAVDNVTTPDNKIYTIVLSSAGQLSDMDNVQVTANGLIGIGSQSLTTLYSEGSFQYTGKKTYEATIGETLNSNYGYWSRYSFYCGGIGYRSYSITNLPTGIKWKLSDDGSFVRFYGKPTVAGRYQATATVVDEEGSTYTYNLIWIIGSDNALAASYTPKKFILDAEGKCYIKSVYPHVTGGSGYYKYELTGSSYNLEFNQDNGYISGTLNAAGTYNLTVKITDQKLSTLTTTVIASIIIDPSVTVAGLIKDADGNPIKGAYVYFTNKDKSVKQSYYDDEEGDEFLEAYKTSTDAKGSYSISIPAGIYDIEASYTTNAQTTHKYLYSQPLSDSRSGFDISLELHKITLYSSNNETSHKFGSWMEWTDADGDIYGYGDTLYLKDGNYTLTAKFGGCGYSSDNEAYFYEIPYEATVTFTAGQTNMATALIKSTPIGNLTLNQTVDLTVKSNNEYVYYTFKPSKNTTYFFRTDTDSFPSIVLFDQKGELLTSSWQSLSYSLKAGSTYYISIGGYDSATGTLTVTEQDKSNYGPAVEEDQFTIAEETETAEQDAVPAAKAASEAEENIAEADSPSVEAEASTGEDDSEKTAQDVSEITDSGENTFENADSTGDLTRAADSETDVQPAGETGNMETMETSETITAPADGTDNLDMSFVTAGSANENMEVN